MYISLCSFHCTIIFCQIKIPLKLTFQTSLQRALCKWFIYSVIVPFEFIFWQVLVNYGAKWRSKLIATNIFINGKAINIPVFQWRKPKGLLKIGWVRYLLACNSDRNSSAETKDKIDLWYKLGPMFIVIFGLRCWFTQCKS